MADLDGLVIDLEDGEIESDGDPTVADEPEPTPETTVTPANSVPINQPQSKDNKKKKSKNHNKGDKPNKLKNKKNKFPAPFEDDFAGTIEKAIRKVLRNEQEEEEEPKEVEEDGNGEEEVRRKTKKRKKHDGGGSGKKKRRRQNLNDDVNDEEMMFTRGASPVRRSTSPYDKYRSDDSYASDNSFDDPRNHPPRPQRNRPHFKDRKNNKNRDRRRDNIHPLQDPDGVCIYYMQGKCHKGDDCSFSHAAQPPRKMELCKFYLMDCCAKRDKCLYLHADFPCKYYHTGLPCIYKDECKFAHGKPLTENFKSILLKHIESAPKEILGEFPRLSRESAAMMVANTQMRLAQQFSPGSHELNDRGIPSIFELNVNKPMNSEDTPTLISPNSQLSHDKHLNKMNQKVRQSRWHQQCNMGNMVPSLVGNPLGNQTQDILSIKNLTGVLTQQQISELTNLGIENLNQLSQLTVIQLNNFGINIQQIQEIQLNTRSIQKLGLIENQPAMPNFANTIPGTQDFDMRIAPMAPEVTSTPAVAPAEVVGRDVDMRFASSVTHTGNNHPQEDNKSHPIDPRVNKDTIDIDQYTKDALKFASKEKENIDNMSSEHFQEHIEEFKEDVHKSKDVDQRVLQYVTDIPPSVISGSDTDIRFLQPDYPKKATKRHRRSTTDDEDNNLLIDEKWYSSDEEKNFKSKSPKESPRPTTPPSLPPVIGATTVLNKLGDLSKIDISDEVTKLLTSMKNNLQEKKEKLSSPASDHSKPRDPRNLPKRSPDHKSPSVDLGKIVPQRRSSIVKISIYECIEGEPTDGRKRSDVDLRQLDQDFRLPGFGDTDLRQSSSDVDFRYGLPFKPLPNYTPATEIDGSINCHPPIVFKLKTIDIPRPDYTDIKNSTAKSQAMADPRLRKLFRLSIDESSSDNEKSVKVTAVPRADPRRKPNVAEITEQQKPSSIDLQNVTNTSTWYKELSTNQKIFVNQQLATVTSLIKKFQQEKIPGKRFDVSQVHTNPNLISIFINLGISLDDNGEFSYLNKSQEGLLKPPSNFHTNPDSYNSNIMDMMNTPQMQMGSVGPMGNMNMNPMNVFNTSFPPPDPRSAPGLLGVAPNMPHGYDNSNFGPPNFGPDSFHANMPYNNGNDFGNMDGEQNFHRNQNRGNYRGRGNDRWNRGGSNRGNRDRRNFNDRGGGGGGGGGWKN